MTFGEKRQAFESQKTEFFRISPGKATNGSRQTAKRLRKGGKTHAADTPALPCRTTKNHTAVRAV